MEALIFAAVASGVFAAICFGAGVAAAYFYLDLRITSLEQFRAEFDEDDEDGDDELWAFPEWHPPEIAREKVHLN